MQLIAASSCTDVGPIPESVYAYVGGGIDEVFQHPAIKTVVDLFKTRKANCNALLLLPGYRCSKLITSSLHPCALHRPSTPRAPMLAAQHT
jgi:hypothetical protein